MYMENVLSDDPFQLILGITKEQVNDCPAYHTHRRHLAIPPGIVLSSYGSRPISGVNLLPPLRPTIDSTSIQILTALIDSYKQVQMSSRNCGGRRLIQYTIRDITIITIIMNFFTIASLLAIMASVTVQAFPVGAPADPDYGVSRLAI
jgi:hypothetical protein